MEQGISEQVNISLIAIVAGAFGILLTVINALQKVVEFKIDSWKQVMAKRLEIKLKDMDNIEFDYMEHPFWTNLYTYLNTELGHRSAPNEFKRQVTAHFIRSSWMIYERWLKDEFLPNIDEDSKELDIFERIINGSEKIRLARRVELIELGVDERVINVFERQRAAKVEMKMELYKTVLLSKAYISVYARVWALLDLQNYLMEQMADESWDSIARSNGELYGLQFNGYTNSPPLAI